MEITKILIDWIGNTVYLDKSSSDAKFAGLYNDLLKIIGKHNGNTNDIESFSESHSFRDSIIMECQYMINNANIYRNDIEHICDKLWKNYHVDII